MNDKAEELIGKLEFAIDDLFNDLKSEIEEKGLKKKHKDAISQVHYLINSVRSRLWPRSGPVPW